MSMSLKGRDDTLHKESEVKWEHFVLPSTHEVTLRSIRLVTSALQTSSLGQANQNRLGMHEGRWVSMVYTFDL